MCFDILEAIVKNVEDIFITDHRIVRITDLSSFTINSFITKDIFSSYSRMKNHRKPMY